MTRAEPTAGRKFFNLLLPVALRDAYPLTVPTDYLDALHPEVCNGNNVYRASLDLAVDWLSVVVEQKHLNATATGWVKNVTHQVTARQNIFSASYPEQKLARRINFALQDIYDVDADPFNGSSPSNVFGMLLYLAPPTSGLYGTGTYTDWARSTAAKIYEHVETDIVFNRMGLPI